MSNSIIASQQFISNEAQEFLNLVFVGLPNWKWLSLVSGLIVLYFLRGFILWLFVKIKKSQKYFSDNTFLQFFLEQEIEKGLSWVAISLISIAFFENLGLGLNFDKYIFIFIKLFLSINIIRICYLAAEAFGLSVQEWAKTTETELDDQLAPFVNKTLKVAVIIIGALIVLQNFGVNVTALLAGLGIGGVALAFAAQDTVSNVFGTITILLDSPFKLGDNIKIGETEGTVIDIGFRSTHIKTPYNSVVTLPNSMVAKEKIDNLTKRYGWVRFRHVLGFNYNSTTAAISQFSEKLKAQLLLDSSVDASRIFIHLNNLADSSINVVVSFHYQLPESQSDLTKINDYLELILNLTSQEKLSFAFPTRTLITEK